MNRIRRFFNQNRRTIFVVIIFIVFFIIIIQLLNKQAEKSLKEQKAIANIQTESKPNKSAISGYETNENIYATYKNIISNFVEYCNNKEVQKAYELISTDCKEELYPTVQDFKESYYDKIFKNKRTFSMQNWDGQIYIVRYTEDILASGKVNGNTTIQDYVTIISENSQLKLNINSYIGKEIINKEENQNNIKIKIVQKRSYMDYEIYDFEVENNSGNIIILDTLINSNSTYLTDANGTNHYSINNEITKESLMVKNKYKNNISIKFDNPYISDRKIKSVTFGEIAVYNAKNISEDLEKTINYTIEI